jgi:hypothetical protein
MNRKGFKIMWYNFFSKKLEKPQISNRYMISGRPKRFIPPKIVKNRKLYGTALAKNGEFCGHVRRTLSYCAVNLTELCKNFAVKYAGLRLLARVTNNATR